MITPKNKYFALQISHHAPPSWSTVVTPTKAKSNAKCCFVISDLLITSIVSKICSILTSWMSHNRQVRFLKLNRYLFITNLMVIFCDENRKNSSNGLICFMKYMNCYFCFVIVSNGLQWRFIFTHVIWSFIHLFYFL